MINWGATKFPSRVTGTNIQLINQFDAVNRAGNKLLAFQRLQENPNVRIPTFSTSQEDARRWLADNLVVVCRTSLRGHSGAGIVIATNLDELVEAPLYVQYVKKISEFRVHVFQGNVIDVQQKRRRSDYDGEPDTRVRNHHTGWVYCRSDIEEPADLRDMAIAAVRALSLDFGAVDCIYNRHHNQTTVLEVNTAPGLEGTTLERYTEAFSRRIG